jgi:drug/metabolite transporter (DMT)-like permease
MNLKAHATPRIVWCVLWALSLIATAFLVKGNPAGTWIEGAINAVGILVFLVFNSRRKDCVR